MSRPGGGREVPTAKGQQPEGLVHHQRAEGQQPEGLVHHRDGKPVPGNRHPRMAAVVDDGEP